MRHWLGVWFMGARLRRSSKAGAITLLVAIALVTSAWLAYATSAPSGQAGSSGGVTTTTVVSPTTSKPTTTTTPSTECKPGNGYGDKNHCHSGPPGRDR